MKDTPKNRYESICLVLWLLKIPEILSTFAALIGLGLYIGGSGDVFWIAIVIRGILFPIRLAIINVKRKIEKEFPSVTNKKYTGRDAYRALELGYLRTVDKASKLWNKK